MRVAVVDIGTNSTRLLVADVGSDGELTELDRRTTVTRLGDGVDAAGALNDAAMERVHAALAGYRDAIDALGSPPAIAVLTSAVRDAANGGAFTDAVAERHGLDAKTLSGDDEARLTFLGATAHRPAQPSANGARAQLVVVDIGGGSSEFVVGRGDELTFHVSTQAGAVRQSERHLHEDPPSRAELDALRGEASQIITEAVPEPVRLATVSAIAVAGTATSIAAIDLALDPYDPERVHGHRVSLQRIEAILGALAAITEYERRSIIGLHPDRAPTIVAGAALLVAALQAFGLDEVEVSEHDILRGAALDHVRRAAASD